MLHNTYITFGMIASGYTHSKGKRLERLYVPPNLIDPVSLERSTLFEFAGLLNCSDF